MSNQLPDQEVEEGQDDNAGQGDCEANEHVDDEHDTCGVPIRPSGWPCIRRSIQQGVRSKTDLIVSHGQCMACCRVMLAFGPAATGGLPPNEGCLAAMVMIHAAL